MATAVVTFDTTEEQKAFEATPNAQSIVDNKVTEIVRFFAAEQRAQLAAKIIDALDSDDTDIRAAAERVRTKATELADAKLHR